MSGLLAGLLDTVKMSREHALLGNYGTSLVYFDGAMQQISSFIKSQIDPSVKSKWMRVKDDLASESNLVREMQQQLLCLKMVPGSHKDSGYQVQKESGYHRNAPSTPQQQQLPSSGSTYLENDPDVWPPPTAEPRNAPSYGYRGAQSNARGPPGRDNSRDRDTAAAPSWARPTAAAASKNKASTPQKTAPPPAAAAAPQSNAARNVAAGYGRLNGISGRNPGSNSSGSGAHTRGGARGAAKPVAEPEPEPDGGAEVGARKKGTFPCTAAEKDMAEMIEHDILETACNVRWADIGGLREAKMLMEEAVVYPLWAPELFQGMRKPWSGVLMYGPPGTGKTLLAKAVATECGITFFNVSLATMESKYRGESEKMVRLLFQMARYYAPSCIFFDEIDGIFAKRGSEGEHEASRRMKNMMLTEINGIQSAPSAPAKDSGEGEEQSGSKMVMVLAATNYPWDLDEALIRRLEKRIYIPLPDQEAREDLFRINLRSENLHPSVDLKAIAARCEGYSGSDISTLCRDACMLPFRRAIRGLTPDQVRSFPKERLKEYPVTVEDLDEARSRVNSTVSQESLKKYKEWSEKHGSA
eukprot:ANDGO_05840.mRNA.1 Katanin p60 ATPase-containing subunit A1